MRAGASLSEITEKVFRHWELSTLRLWGAIIESLRLDGRMVWAADTMAMRSRYGASADRGDGVVNLLASVSEADIAIVFREREDGLIEVSLRSRPEVDVASIAQYFGGGGHPQAAGCSLEGKLEEVIQEVLAKARERFSSPLEG
jgi:phosphoesterase RecJ-like protein